MKSNADQMRIVAWLASASNSQKRRSALPHAHTRDRIRVSSNTVWAGIQNRFREIPPRDGWIKSGRFGQNGSTTRNSYKPPPKDSNASAVAPITARFNEETDITKRLYLSLSWRYLTVKRVWARAPAALLVLQNPSELARVAWETSVFPPVALASSARCAVGAKIRGNPTGH